MYKKNFIKNLWNKYKSKYNPREKIITKINNGGIF